jgi:hypothetical protein
VRLLRLLAAGTRADRYVMVIPDSVVEPPTGSNKVAAANRYVDSTLVGTVALAVSGGPRRGAARAAFY